MNYHHYNLGENTMAERYEKLFSSYDKYCSVGSPALIAAEAILKDTKEDKVKAQLKFQNITNKTIKAVNIKIKAYDSFGRELQGIEEYQYADLSVFQGEYWGQDKAITLPNELTRTIKVGILSVVFQDDTIWECESNVWNKLSEPKKLYSLLLDDELVKQYKLEYGELAEYVYLEEEGIWHCTCGTINLSSAEKCYHCRASKDNILNCDLDFLKANADARVAKEKAEAEEKARIKAEEEEKARIAEKERLEREAIKKKKRNKFLMITIPVAVVVITLLALTPNVIKPAIENAIAYNKASKLLNEGSFDDAQIAFQELGDYKDSADMALESQYKKAEMFFGEMKYEEAIEVWDSLGDYSDSKERILMTEETRNEKDYQKAIALMNEQEYDEAAEILLRLGDYKDSSKIVDECTELQKEVDYQLAMSLLTEGKYSRAIEEFDKLKGYKDSDELAIYISYDYACELLANQMYYDSFKYFEKASGYKDADAKLLDAKFECSVVYKEKNLNPYALLKELAEIDYPGAKELYDELYQWRLKVNFYQSTSTSKPIDSMAIGKYIFAQVEIVSGAYGERLPIVVYITYPNGEKEIFEHEWDGGKGLSDDVTRVICGIKWDKGIDTKGTLKVRVEDTKGNTIGSGSIKITD